MLNYINYFVKYTINQENIAQAITISNIDISLPEFHNIKESASVIQDNYYYFSMKDFIVLMDVFSKELTFIAQND